MTYKGFSNILQGVGGAGLFSDGKLNFIPTLGKTDLTEFLPRDQAQELVDYVEKTFARFEMDSETFPRDMEKAKDYYKQAKKLGLDLLLIKQKHIGTDMLPNYINEMVNYLETCSVKFLTQAKATQMLVKDGRFAGVQTSKGDFYAPNIIVAPGRSGSNWWYNKALELNLNVSFRPVEIGVRVEVPEEVMRDITDIIYDPTLFLYSETYDDQLRTFCTNRRGFVIREDYEDFFCVNGSAYKNRFSNNTNFALLSRVNLTEPVTDTYRYGASIGRLATTIGGGKPLLQRYIDLEKGRRSTWNRLAKAFMEPTQKDVTPGDIDMAMPKILSPTCWKAFACWTD